MIKDFFGSLKERRKNIYLLFAMLMLGFSAGIPLALTGTTLTIWLARLNIDVKTIGILSLVILPFSFKFLWAPIFDNLKLPFLSDYFGLRRSWLVLIQILLILVIYALGMTDPLNDLKMTIYAAVLVSFFSASQDILIDALRIEILPKDQQALGTSMYVYGYRIAMLTSGAGSLLLAEYISWEMTYAIMSFSILVGIFTVISIAEPEITKEKIKHIIPYSALRKKIFLLMKDKEFFLVLSFLAIILVLNQLNLPIYATATIVIIVLSFYKNKFVQYIPSSLLEFCNRKQWLTILLFIIFYKFSDTLLDSLKSKFYVDAGFSNKEIALITKGFGFVMTLVGLFIGGIIYLRFKTFKSLLYILILQMLSNLVFLWVAATQHNLVALATAIAIENLTASMSNTIIIAYLSSLCNLYYTATQYALLSSFSNIGRSLMVAPGGYIVDLWGWKVFIILSAVVGLPSLFLLFRLKGNIIDSEK